MPFCAAYVYLWPKAARRRPTEMTRQLDQRSVPSTVFTDQSPPVDYVIVNYRRAANRASTKINRRSSAMNAIRIAATVLAALIFAAPASAQTPKTWTQVGM